jgi:mannose-6-phosphate isomerase-like protein (cupin superfamily)
VLSTNGPLSTLLLRRDTTGLAEVHADWSDVFIVQAGSAMVLHGGSVTGGSTTAPGELRGGRIVGGKLQSIGPGDVLIIPAGVPHQVVVTPRTSITYLVVKTAKPR